MNKKGASFGTIVVVMGSILIALGIAWLIAQNWRQIPSFLKITILVFLTASAYVIGVVLREKDYPTIAKSLFVLGALLYTLSIFLIAQIFHTSTSLQNVAWLVFLAWMGVIFSAYFFNSYTTLIIGLIEFLVWIILQFMALLETISQPFALYLFLFLFAGILFYGLSLWHRYNMHDFAKLFQWWTAFYFLLFVYVMSFQSFIPMMWNDEIVMSATSITFLVVFALIALATTIPGIFVSMREGDVSGKEILGMFIVLVVLIGLMGLTKVVSSKVGVCYTKQCYEFGDQNSCFNMARSLSCEWKENSCRAKSCYDFKDRVSCENAPSALRCEWRTNGCKVDYSRSDLCGIYNDEKQECVSHPECGWRTSYGYFRRGREAPLILWFVWIAVNVFFILLILAVIGYGTLEKSTAIINLGIMFFSLDILTRYMGFVMDFWGYTSLAIIFIIGGILLIVGGWLIVKWRKRLVTKAKEQSPQVRRRKNE